jgi:hypothetical protein
MTADNTDGVVHCWKVPLGDTKVLQQGATDERIEYLCIGRSASGTTFVAMPPLARAGKLRGSTDSATAVVRAPLRVRAAAWETLLILPAIAVLLQ